MKKENIEKRLSNRDKNLNRNKINGYLETYAEYKKNTESYRNSIQYQQEWTKVNYWQYGLPLNINYEADIIYYLDKLPSIKPYISTLIRKEMADPYVNVKPNARDFVKGDNTKQRSFGLKFNKRKDKDIIDYLQTKESKRAYLIGLIRKDIENNNFEVPKWLDKYVEKSKVRKRNVKKELYCLHYHFIENKLKDGKHEIDLAELASHIRSHCNSELKDNTLNNYRSHLFTKPHVLVFNSERKIYLINEKEFEKLEKPE